jgi:hypothetical protein
VSSKKDLVTGPIRGFCALQAFGLLSEGGTGLLRVGVRTTGASSRSLRPKDRIMFLNRVSQVSIPAGAPFGCRVLGDGGRSAITCVV